MDGPSELSQFLTSRRAKVTPEQAGMPTYGKRRWPGLRREEVASLAGVSVEYCTRRECGNATGASHRSYAPLFESREHPPNSARFTFLDPSAQEFFLDCEKTAKNLVATCVCSWEHGRSSN